jgi:hypothetical protein
MIKIDIEGHESSVIEGAMHIIHTHKLLIYIINFSIRFL